MKEQALEKLCDILETPDVKETDVLRDFEMWDSLTGLSIIAMADTLYGVTLPAVELKKLITVGELLAHLEAHKTK
jgi:acyl carrier protein